LSIAVEDFSRIHPTFPKKDYPADDIYSDFTSISHQLKSHQYHNELKHSETLQNLPVFDKMTHFAKNFGQCSVSDQSLGEIIIKQSRISKLSDGPNSEKYSEFRNDARSASTPIPEQELSEENSFEIRTNSCLSSSFTVPQNFKPPVQNPTLSLGSNFGEPTYLSEPESNVINVLQQKIQRELRTLPFYSTAMKDDNDIYKVICKLELGEFKYASDGFDKSKEVAKRKSAENMLRILGDHNLLNKLPTHDRIETIIEAKKYFLEHLRNNKNRTLQIAFNAVADDDGRSVCQHLHQMSRFSVIQCLPSEKITSSGNGFTCEISTRCRYKLRSNNLAVIESPTMTAKINHATKKLATRGAWNNLVNTIFKFLNNFGEDIELN